LTRATALLVSVLSWCQSSPVAVRHSLSFDYLMDAAVQFADQQPIL